MQRYRVNYRLLIILGVGFVVTAGALHGLWKFQVSRNSNQLLARAEDYQQKGELQDAFESMLTYTALQPEDTEGRIKMADIAAKLAEEIDPSDPAFRDAYSQLLDAALRTDDPGVRRKLLDIQAKYGLYDIAMQNAQILMDRGDQDVELKVIKARALFATQKDAEGAAWCKRLIGYDQRTDEFDPKLAEAPDKPIVYAMLAQYLLGKEQKDLARRVNDRMVEVNPESSEAYLYRYQIFNALNEKDAAQEALARAAELAPDDAGVLAARGIEKIVAYQTGLVDAEKNQSEDEKKAAVAHLDEAAEIFTKALEKYPERGDFYERVARISLFREKFDDALAIIEKGIKKFPLRSSVGPTGIPLGTDLVNMKLEILFSQTAKDPGKFQDIKSELKKLRDLDNSRLGPLIEYQEARIDAIQERWPEAAKRMERVKRQLISFPDLQASASFIQGFCHQQLGQDDLALEAYNWALQKNPADPRSTMAREELLRKRGQPGRQVDTTQLDELVKQMLARPESAQDWDSLYTKIDEFLERQASSRRLPPNWVESRKNLMRAQTLIVRAEAQADEKKQRPIYQEARKYITEAYRLMPTDTVVQMAVPKLLMTEPGSGPDKALAVLNQFISKHGDSPQYRMLKTEILMAKRDPNVVDELMKATEDMGEWPDSAQAQVWATIAARLEQLNKLQEASDALNKAIDLAPNSLPFRNALFSLALKRNDDAAMQQAQERILEVVGDKSDPDYVLSEAKRRTMLYATKKISADELREVDRMLAAAVKSRPTFGDLYLTRGQIALMLDSSDVSRALRFFDQALDRGEANPGAVAIQVKLLYDQGRIKEARDRLSRLPEGLWSVALGRTVSELLQANGETDLAIREAEKLAKANPNDPAVQSYIGEFLYRLGKTSEGEQNLVKAVELNDTDPDAWAKLISFYLREARYEDVERVMREAHIALDEEFLPLLNAQYYERQGRWQEAEDIYLSAYEKRLDDPLIAQRLAIFYLTWFNANDANPGRAARYVNQILRMVNEGKLAKDHRVASWGRRQAARLLSSQNDYAKSLQAERVLMEGADEDGNLLVEDQLQLVEVLDKRGDPASLERVAQILRDLRKKQPLDPSQELRLGKALERTGRWAEAKKQMADAIGRYPQDGPLRIAYTRMLIDRGERYPSELDEADRWITRMSEVPTIEQSMGEMRLRLIGARGDKKAIRTAFEKVTPNLRVLNQKQIDAIRVLALLADDIGDSEYGIKLMREYVQRTSGNEIQLARMLAQSGDVDEALNMLKVLYDDHIDDVTTFAVEMLRRRRDEAPAKLDEEVSRMIANARREDPEAARYMILEAEMLEIQQKYDESMKAYADVLAMDDIPPIMRATASNNLAFLMALKKTDLDQAMETIETAVGIIGPISDILDTRGLVYLAQGNVDRAAKDFRLAANSGPTLGKFFHLAQALDAAGDEEGAQTAWKEATSLGLSAAKLTPLERPGYEALAKKFGATSTASTN